jgi:hypothetical protein
MLEIPNIMRSLDKQIGVNGLAMASIPDLTGAIQVSARRNEGGAEQIHYS